MAERIGCKEKAERKRKRKRKKEVAAVVKRAMFNQNERDGRQCKSDKEGTAAGSHPTQPKGQ